MRLHIGLQVYQEFRVCTSVWKKVWRYAKKIISVSHIKILVYCNSKTQEYSDRYTLVLKKITGGERAGGRRGRRCKVPCQYVNHTRANSTDDKYLFKLFYTKYVVLKRTDAAM